MRAFRAVAVAVFLVIPALVPMEAQRAAPAPAAAKLQLSIDTVMKGPDLVGWPPTAVRWSADSQKLYFEWRKPGETEGAPYVVERAGGEPRKLSEEDVRHAPPANGRWDKAHRRLLYIDGGD